MFCTKCGLKNDDQALFCARCGTKIIIPEGMQTDLQSENKNNESNDTEKVVLEKDLKEATTENTTENIGYSFFQQEPVNKGSDEVVGNVNIDTNTNANTNTNIDTNANTNTNTNISDNDSVTEESQESKFNFINEEKESNDNQVTYDQPYDNSVLYNNESQSDNGQTYNGNNQIHNVTDRPKNKFSVKRFIFSALLIIATIASCVGIAFKYLEMETKYTYDGDSYKDSDQYKGYEIIKDDDFCVKGEAKEYLGDAADTVDLIRIIVIVFAISLIVLAIIEFVLLIVVRRRWVYVLSMLFSMIELGLGGYVIYLWCFKLLDQIKSMYSISSMSTGSYKLTANLGAGIIITVATQVVVFICSIILITCKNRPKVKNK
jgi:hypothetical protein